MLTDLKISKQVSFIKKFADSLSEEDIEGINAANGLYADQVVQVVIAAEEFFMSADDDREFTSFENMIAAINDTPTENLLEGATFFDGAWSDFMFDFEQMLEVLDEDDFWGTEGYEHRFNL